MCFLGFNYMLVIQVMITFIAVDFFGLVDLEQYDLPLDILSLHPDKVVMQFIKGQVSCKAN